MAPSTKQRRSRARRRASQRVVLQETVLAAEDAQLHILVIIATPLIAVFDVDDAGQVETRFMYPLAPWGQEVGVC